MSNDFEFPEYLDVGDPVEYSADGTSQDRCMALITEVKRGSAKSVDLMLFPSMEPRRDCWHIKDPRVETRKDVFIEQENRGVFRLVGNHKHREAMAARLDSLERVCRDLVRDNGKLKLQMQELQESQCRSDAEPSTFAPPIAEQPKSEPQQRKRGRPRKPVQAGA